MNLDDPKSFKPRFTGVAVVLYADGDPAHKTETKDRVRLPGAPVLVHEDFHEPIGMADLYWDGDRVMARLYLERIPAGLYPQLAAAPTDGYEGDRVIAVGEGDEADVMVCELAEDRQICVTDLALTRIPPVDQRLALLDPAAFQDLSERAETGEP